MLDREKPTPLVATPVTDAPRGKLIGSRNVSFANTFSALKYRNYRLFFFGQLTSLIGTWMQNVAQAWLVYDLTKSPFYLGIVSFASAVPVLFLSVWAGVIVDRVPKRRLLLITQTGAMLLAFLLSLDVFAGTVQAWHIPIFSFLLGMVNTFDAPTRQAFVVEMVGREDLMNAIALNSAVFNSARIIGPTLAGIALAVVGSAWCFFLNGVSFLAVIAGLWLMQVKPFVAPSRKGSSFAQLREGLAYIAHHQSIRSLMALVAVANIFAFGYSALMPAFASDVLHAGEVGLGLLSAAVGVGALCGALIIASLGNVQRKGVILTFGNLLFPIAVIAFAFSPTLPLSMAILVFVGLGFMIQNTTVNTLVQTMVPDELRGRVMAVYMMVFQGFFPIGSLIAGTIAQNFGVTAGAAFGGAVALAFSLFLMWRAPHIRKLA